jgi:hypothetical protein
MKVFLRLKNREIFTLIFGLPIVMAVIALLIMKIFNNQLLEYRLMISISLIVGTGFFGWIWSIAIGFQNKLPVDLKMKTKMFRVIMLFSFVIFVCIMFLMLIDNPMKMELLVGKQLTITEKLPGIIFSVISTLSFFALIFILYCFYFAAKTIKTIELQKKVILLDFVVEFLMICLFPIGIWIIQPRINQLAENKE